MKNYDVVIIGGGASGLYTAININKTKKVLIIDKADKLGKKILATGNGRCNLTNANINACFYNSREVCKYIAKYDNKAILSHFDNIGLKTYCDKEGRYYPLSNSANSVLDLLLKQVEINKNIEVLTNANIIDIKKSKDLFTITVNDKVIESKNLVISTGGNSGKQYLEKLGVKYSEFIPSLVSLKTEKNKSKYFIHISHLLFLL